MKPITTNAHAWITLLLIGMIIGCDHEEDENQHLIPVVNQGPLTAQKFKTALEAFTEANSSLVHSQLVGFGHKDLTIVEVNNMLSMFKQIAPVVQALEPEVPLSLANSKDWEQVCAEEKEAEEFLQRVINEVKSKVVFYVPLNAAKNCDENAYVRQALVCFYTYTGICVENKKRLYCMLPENIAVLAACTLASCQ